MRTWNNFTSELAFDKKISQGIQNLYFVILCLRKFLPDATQTAYFFNRTFVAPRLMLLGGGLIEKLLRYSPEGSIHNKIFTKSFETEEKVKVL